MKHLSLLLFTLSLANAQTEIRGFAAADLKAEQDRETAVRKIPEPNRIKTYMERMAREPHHAGSPASKEVAEYAAGLLKEWGFDVRIEEFEALLPYPTARSLEMVRPVKYKAKLHEPVVKEDKHSADKNQLPTY